MFRAAAAWCRHPYGSLAACSAVLGTSAISLHETWAPPPRRRAGLANRDSSPAVCESIPPFQFCGKTATHTPVFSASPAGSTASVNVNGALLRNYARSKGNHGMKEDVYDRLYSLMVQQAQAHPGQLQIGTDARVAGAIRDLGLVGCFSRVPLGGVGAGGAVFIDVYALQHRPLSPKNVALLYVEAPRGLRGVAPAGPVGSFKPVFDDRDSFLQAVEETAANILVAVSDYNSFAEKNAQIFPQIDILQLCLISGAQRHAETTKLDVASAIVRGVIAASSDASNQKLPAIRFSYDEGVFEKAVQSVTGL
eukprot:TRINITY_DN95178_c0_g1_i1.p1 TRINITY_DN95178_c0_g1~~TRINITY_DN95178_c0_g1_i1.p1  ORF type:complete len:318 (+),score=58.21 TRINITY_DN95178_c0_g1_i1:32-955(+)